MNSNDIQTLRKFCEDFKRFRDLERNGEGKSLHDIKYSFDYVRESIDKYGLTGTNYGTGLSERATKAGDVLSQLWNCLQNLEISIENFCTEQENNNKQR